MWIHTYHLATKQSQKLIEIEEKLDKLKQEVQIVVKQNTQPVDLEDSISGLTKRLDNFSISGKLPVKKSNGQIYVFEDPNKIFKEQFGKESKKWLPEDLASLIGVLLRLKQNSQLKKIKSVVIDKWPEVDIKQLGQQEEYSEEATTIAPWSPL